MKDTIDQKLMNKIQALKNMIINGETGERENAQRRLDVIIEKYCLSEEQIDAELLSEHKYFYPDPYIHRLLQWVIFHVTGAFGSECKINDKTYISIICSEWESDEIDFLFNFYKYHIDKEVEFFVDGFCQKQGLIHPLMPEQRYYKETTEIKERIKKEYAHDFEHYKQNKEKEKKKNYYQNYFEKKIPIKDGIEDINMENSERG